MEKLGFIILRHVNDISNNKHYLKSYNSIRKYYPENYIMIIDDNSNKNLLDDVVDKTLYKTIIINSDYPGRGELLPYYYYFRFKVFDIAVIIHDSVFINSYIDFTNVEKYKIIWDFDHYWDEVNNETNLIKQLNNSNELLDFYYNKKIWRGCFGSMTVINHNFLKKIYNKYNLDLLLNVITNRQDRMAFERVIACILQLNEKYECLLGNIHYYCPWGIELKDIESYHHLPIIKVWCGR